MEAALKVLLGSGKEEMRRKCSHLTLDSAPSDNAREINMSKIKKQKEITSREVQTKSNKKITKGC